MLESNSLKNIYTYSFKDKLNYEAKTSLLNKRDKINIKEIGPKKQSLPMNIWDRNPIDFNPSVYHPRPLKRNSKEAIKPWSYDKYLKPIDSTDLNKDHDWFLKNRLSKIELFNEVNYNKNNNNITQNFKKFFRPLSPNEDRFQTAKTNGFRYSLGIYMNPVPHDFRGLKPLYGKDDFNLRFNEELHDKNKFLSQQLLTIHIENEDIMHLRDIDSGLQMGDLVKKKDPNYVSSLILPKLSYPNKFYGYTRYRPKVRSVESAFWDHVLPKINEKWNSEKEMFNKSV